MEIQVLDRAFNVLEFVAQDPERPMSVGEIAQGTGLNRPTCTRILKDLASRGYVEQKLARGGYTLGPMAFVLASRGSYDEHLVKLADQQMRELADAIGETVILVVLRQGKRYTISTVEGNQTIQVKSDIVYDSAPYARATGRLLIAHYDGEELERFVANNGLPGDDWPEIDSRETLNSALSEIRDSNAYSFFRGELVALAAPVRRDGAVVASLGVYMPAHRFTVEHRENVTSKLAKAAQAISKATY